jgi:hypothetical protein
MTDLLERRGMPARLLYRMMGIKKDRFWDQFKDTRSAPRLDIVQKMADVLGVPLWRLLLRNGESPPDLDADNPDHRTVRHFVRSASAHFAASCEIPRHRRSGETELNFRIRQNIAIGLWQCWKTEIELREQLGIHRAAWHSMAKRKTGIGMDTLWLIAEALSMEPWELVAPVRTGG